LLALRLSNGLDQVKVVLLLRQHGCHFQTYHRSESSQFHGLNERMRTLITRHEQIFLLFCFFEEFFLFSSTNPRKTKTTTFFHRLSSNLYIAFIHSPFCKLCHCERLGALFIEMSDREDDWHGEVSFISPRTWFGLICDHRKPLIDTDRFRCWRC
jgi:hypothetical protein